jgi:hypothetical protein
MLTVKEVLNKKKGQICKEFEKVCPTSRSFERVVKEMHDIFDELERELTTVIKERTYENEQ